MLAWKIFLVVSYMARIREKERDLNVDGREFVPIKINRF